MSMLRNIKSGLRSLFRKERVEGELDEELRGFLEMAAEEKMKQGMSLKDALRAVRLERGNLEATKELVRSAGWESFIEALWQDLRFALRMLRKSPGFTAVAVLTLALGIGANTAIFSLLNAVVLRILPIRYPQQLVQLTYTGIGDWNSYFGYPELERFRSEARTVSGVFGGTGLGRMNVLFHGTTNLAQGDAYTENFFSVLGVTPEHGRLFADGDDVEASVVVLSDRYWRVRFGADPSVVGQTVTINQIPFTIVGIAAREFSGVSLGSAPDLWLPLHALDRFKLDANRWKGCDVRNSAAFRSELRGSPDRRAFDHHFGLRCYCRRLSPSSSSFVCRSDGSFALRVVSTRILEGL